MKKKSFAIIGNPIAHSLSPVLHNYWFNKYNIAANYSLLNIDEKDIEGVIKKIRNKELSGINITLPYKQKIIPFSRYGFKVVLGNKPGRSVKVMYSVCACLRVFGWFDYFAYVGV